jgi:hypothetical protein
MSTCHSVSSRRATAEDRLSTIVLIVILGDLGSSGKGLVDRNNFAAFAAMLVCF